MAIEAYKLAASGDMALRMLTHAGKKMMPGTSKALSGNTSGLTRNTLAGELRAARAAGISPASDMTAQSSLKAWLKNLMTRMNNPSKLGPSKLGIMDPIIRPGDMGLQGGIKSSAWREGFISRLQERGFTQKQAEDRKSVV